MVIKLDKHTSIPEATDIFLSSLCYLKLNDYFWISLSVVLYERLRKNCP